MCYRKFYIYNKAKQYDPFHGGPLYLVVRCGQCDQCLREKQNEYLVRALAEHKWASDNNGFTYWDSLTYKDATVPEYLGLICFDPKHISAFRKRLHINIKRYTKRYFKEAKEKKIDYLRKKIDKERSHQLQVLRSQFPYIKNNIDYKLKKKSLDQWFIKYFNQQKRDLVKVLRKQYQPYSGLKIAQYLHDFVVSEFGGITHRPHYHIMFFCTLPNMNAYLLQSLIYKSWKMGRLDYSKLPHQRVITSTGGAIQYVMKYLNKDDYFAKNLASKVSRARLFYGRRIADKIWNKKRIRQISNFHRQTRGFGKCLIDQQDQDLLFHGLCKIPDKNQKFKFLKIPQYIERKLYYKCEKYIDHFESDVSKRIKSRWILTSKGKVRKISLIDEKVAQAATNLSSVLRSLSAYTSDIIPNPSIYQKKIFSMLGDRSVFDLALYSTVFKGRMIHDSIHELPDYKEFITDSLQIFPDSRPLYDNHITQNSIATFTRRKVINNKFLTNKFGSYVYEFYDKSLKYIEYKRNKITLDNLKSVYCIDENRFPCFKDFDKILQLTDMVVSSWNKQKQSLAEEKYRVEHTLTNFEGSNIFNQKYAHLPKTNRRVEIKS